MTQIAGSLRPGGVVDTCGSLSSRSIVSHGVRMFYNVGAAEDG